MRIIGEAKTVKDAGFSTIMGLAQAIGLDAIGADGQEWRKWLGLPDTIKIIKQNNEVAEISAAELTPYMTLEPGQTFTIPNTILATYAGWRAIDQPVLKQIDQFIRGISDPIKKWMGNDPQRRAAIEFMIGYHAEIAYLEAAGFHVEQLTEPLTDGGQKLGLAESFVVRMAELSGGITGEKGVLAGIYLAWAHGGEGLDSGVQFISDETFVPYDWFGPSTQTVLSNSTNNEISVGTNYRLGFTAVKTCHSEYMKPCVTSPNGVYWFTDMQSILDPTPGGAKAINYLTRGRAYGKDASFQRAPLIINVLPPGALGTDAKKMQKARDLHIKPLQSILNRLKD